MATKSRRKPTTSIKAILVRDFNWRMGNLRRIYMNANSLDHDLAAQMRELVHMQMDREQFRHEADLMAVQTGNPGGWQSKHLTSAAYEVERNKRALQHP